MRSYYPIIIIGAGMAGLAAGRRLWDDGYHDFMIVEAAPITGGRIKSWQDAAGQVHELGASFLHSTPHNPVAQLLMAQGQTLTVLEPNEFIMINGRVLDAAAAAQFADHHANMCNAAAAKIAQDPQATAADLLNGDIVHDAALRALAGPTETGIELDQLSLLDVSEQIEDGGNSIVVEGFSSFLHNLAQDLPIMLNTVVSVIDSSGDNIVLATNAEPVSCDKLIVTCSVDVLLDGLTFQPALPVGKQAALAHLRQGVLNKIIVQYEQPLWPQGQTFYGFIVDEKYGQCEAWVLPHAPYTLMVLFGGVQSQTSFADFEQQFACDLVKVLPGLQDNKILWQKTTDWQHDPLTRGSYSALRPGLPDARAIYGEPIDNRIFFAGEAADNEWATQVAGAYISGQQAARELGVIGR